MPNACQDFAELRTRLPPPRATSVRVYLASHQVESKFSSRTLAVSSLWVLSLFMHYSSVGLQQ